MRLSLPKALFAGLVLISLAALPGMSADLHAETRPRFTQVSLTADMVQRFLASYPELKAMGKKYERQVPRKPGAKGPMETLSGYLQHQAARTEMSAILATHGFNSFQDWIGTAQTVAISYGFLKSGQTADSVNDQAAQALAAIENNPRLTSEQKQMMREMLQKQMGTLQRLQPTPENLSVVRRMMPQVQAVMDSD